MGAPPDHVGSGGKRIRLRAQYYFGGGAKDCEGCADRLMPPRACAGCPSHDFAPRLPEEAEAWRIIWPLPPLVRLAHADGSTTVTHIAVDEVRARVRAGFDADLVADLAATAEPSIIEECNREVPR